MEPLGASEVLLGWQVDPASLVVVSALAFAYVRGVVRFGRQHGAGGRGRSWPVGRSVWFAIAVVALVVATQSGVGRYDDERMTIHMLQHLLLGMVAPFALVRSAPVTLALQSGEPGTRHLVRRVLHARATRWVTHPVVTWLLFGGGMVAIYLTPLLELSARNTLVHLLVHVHLVTAGSLFLVGLVGADRLPRPLPFGARLLATLTAVPFHAFLGMVLLSASSPLAPEVYPSLSDQRTAAGLLWVMGEVFSLAVAGVVIADWYRSEQRAGARHDRRDDRPRERHEDGRDDEGGDQVEGSTMQRSDVGSTT